jgi:hypothetical protein
LGFVKIFVLSKHEAFSGAVKMEGEFDQGENSYLNEMPVSGPVACDSAHHQ